MDDVAPGEPRTAIRCPACNAHPVSGAAWFCGPDGCGGVFDTFATRGRCPHCDAQFAWTQCLSCGRVSAHTAYYPRGT